ncbi:MAG TPA: PAS domain S-box protein [Candidatus Acidoferrum sp.]|nr:PAS domain S-box protein [Candidatus Acidoferrum sp.]
MWGFAEFAYLDNPLPSVFKERLFVQLSRFCAVRYCIARHTGFLVGLGRPAGDAGAKVHTPEDVVRLLQRRLPRGSELNACISRCVDCSSPLSELPGPDSELEQAVFALASHVFLQNEDAPRCLETLKRLLGPIRTQYLVVFFTFVRAAHYWTKVHQEIEFEDDLKDLLKTEEALAACVLNDPEALLDGVCAEVVDELPELRRKADRAIRLLATIVDSSEDAIVSKNLNGTILTWNNGAEKLFGYTGPEAIGRHISLVIPHDRLDEEAAIIERIRRGESVDHFDTVRVCKDGALIDVSITISPLRDEAGKIIGASKIVRDITQRKRDERALRESEDRFRTLADALDIQVQFRTQELQRRNREILEQAQQLHDLSSRLLQMQDAERRHIARELHDSAGQTLSVLAIELSRLAKDAKADAKLHERVESAEQLVRQLTQEIRTTSYLPHPPLLDENGLSSALPWYVEGLAQRSGLHVELKVPENFKRLPHEMELVIFRLVQEALTNIHRHSGSKTAAISLYREGDYICAEIQDRGKGISPERLAEIQLHGVGVGILGMRERVRQFQGDLTIDSNPLGTKIRATLFVPAASEDPEKIQQIGAA